MKSLYISALACLFFTSSLYSQTGFIESVGYGNNLDEMIWASASDADGNMYLTGAFSSTSLTLGTITLTNSGSGTSDAFIAKFDATGTIAWAHSYGTANADEARQVVPDDSGNVYFSGYFNAASITIGGFTLTNNGDDDIFIAKADESGTIIWAKGIGSLNDNRPEGFMLDPSNNLVLTGGFTNAPITIGTTIHTNAGNSDFFVVRVNSSNGSTYFSQAFGGSGQDDAQGLSISAASGYIYVGGRFSSPTLVLGTTTLTNSNAGTNEAFVMEINNSDVVSWAERFGGSADEQVNGLLTPTGGANTLFVSGDFSGNTVVIGNDTLTNAGSGNADGFLISITNHIVNWAISVGGTGEDVGFGLATRAPMDDIFMTGVFNSPSITIGSNTLMNSGTGTFDIYVASFDKTSGTPTWEGKAGNTENDFAFGLQCRLNSTSLYLTGWFAGPSITFGSLPIITSAGGNDGFLAEISLITGMNELEREYNFLIYPNPSSGVFTIENSEGSALMVHVYNSNGELTYSMRSTAYKQQIDLTNQQPGLYLYTIQTEHGLQTGKIVKR